MSDDSTGEEECWDDWYTCGKCREGFTCHSDSMTPKEMEKHGYFPNAFDKNGIILCDKCTKEAKEK
jgi:hypothetical protein